MPSAIERFSRRLADEKPYSGDIAQDAEVFVYAINLLLLNAAALATILLLAWPLGTVKSVLLVWASFMSLRIFAGGRHQSGPLKCWLTTVAVITLLGYLVTAGAPLINGYALIIITLGLVFALAAVIFHAPVTIPSKQFALAKQRKLKIAAATVVVFWAVAALALFHTVFIQPTMPLAIIAGLVAQSFSIIDFSGANNKVKVNAAKL
ncbi:MAG: accessory gene regulator B family protein [Firmicutes bacterium]|nr:accessory gene regulator B family protein [Bacillota bacterium]